MSSGRNSYFYEGWPGRVKYYILAYNKCIANATNGEFYKWRMLGGRA